MLEYRQKLANIVEGEKPSKKRKSSKKREERRKIDCSGGPIGVKMELHEWKDWIREADFIMFLYYFYTPENPEFHIMLKSKIKFKKFIN